MPQPARRRPVALMRKPKFPHKPPAPSVRETIGPAVIRAQGLPRDDHPVTQQEIVKDILEKLSLPEPRVRALREKHGLD